MRISVEGNIASGKSLLLSGLQAQMPAATIHPEPVDEWAPLLKQFYEAPHEHALDMQMRVLLDFNKIRQGAEDHGALSIVERSPLASQHVFGMMAHNAGWLDDGQWATYKKMAGILGWEPDGIVYVEVPPEECFRRASLRPSPPGTEPASIEYFRAVDRMYETLLRFTRIPVRRVDGCQPPEGVLRDATEAIQTLL